MRKLLLCPLLFLWSVWAASSIMPLDLRCEYATNPLGIETAAPRLSWRLHSSGRDEMQSAYQVLVASSPDKLVEGQADLWDSGKVPSSESIQIAYRGAKLASRQRCYWKVRVWDKADRPSPFSETAWWEMGLLSPGDWDAEWIGYPPGWNGRALYFRRDIDIPKPVRSARA